MGKLTDKAYPKISRAEYIEVERNVRLHVTDAGEDFPYNLPVSAVDELIELNNKDRPRLLSNFAKIFSATETSLNEGIASWLHGIGLSASSYATAQCLIALRDTDLRSDLSEILIPTLIMHGKKDKICSFDLAEQMKAGIQGSHLIGF